MAFSAHIRRHLVQQIFVAQQKSPQQPLQLARPLFCSLCTDQSAAAAAARGDIESLVKRHSVVVFMKGVPEEPRCGFSNAVVQILRMHGVTSYQWVDVLEDENIRQGVKDYSNWPTIPQLYINGEFVGGCDILMEMHRNGDLVEELKKVGIRSALLDKEESS